MHTPTQADRETAADILSTEVLDYAEMRAGLCDNDSAVQRIVAYRIEAQTLLLESLVAQQVVRDPAAVEALIKAVGDGLADGFTASRWIAVNAAYNQLEVSDE